MNFDQSTFSRETREAENISRIDFAIFSNQEVLRHSVVYSNPSIGGKAGLHVADITGKSVGEPAPGGVMDRHLGVVEKQPCATCHDNNNRCPGHFGHITLIEPVFHIGYIGFLKDVFSCVCFGCARLLIAEDDERLAQISGTGAERLHAVRDLCQKMKVCEVGGQGCGLPVQKYTIDKNNSSINLLVSPVRKQETKGGKGGKVTVYSLSPRKCAEHASRISDQTLRVLGVNPQVSHPQDAIITNLPVPPVQVRPSVRFDKVSSGIKEDDLTHKLLNIITSNTSLAQSRGGGNLFRRGTASDDYVLLQFHVATYFANDIKGLPKSLQKNNKATKSLSQRLKGKKGRFRFDMMGKRVGCTARSVITSDPYVAVDEVGTPLHIAMTLTYPEAVTHSNQAYLQRLVDNGRHRYPGANSVMKPGVGNNGESIEKSYLIGYSRQQLPVLPGDVVHRHLIDDDIVLFGRQPSLHKLSMMGHRIRVSQDPSQHTFRLNVTATEPYNADFDGDEMNMHVPQSAVTCAEVRMKMSIARRFVNPTNSKVVVNVKQDAVMGAYVLTAPGVQIPWRDAMRYVAKSSHGVRSDIPKGTLVSGAALFSAILPSSVSLRGREVDIQSGVLRQGVMNKDNIRALTQYLWFQSSQEEAATFLDDLQRMMLHYLMDRGYTLGVQDLTISQEATHQIQTLVESARKEVMGLITGYENDPRRLSRHAFEMLIRQRLSKVLSDVAQTAVPGLSPESGLRSTIKSGSSGSGESAAQIMGAVGQIIVERRRIEAKFGGRNLPCFWKGDVRPEARGFCHGNFLHGLTVPEIFDHAKAATEGISNTALKTAETGYQQRKFVKLLEDVKVEYDGTVRNANGRVIQLVYGDNTCNTEVQTPQKIHLIGMTDEQVQGLLEYPGGLRGSRLRDWTAKYFELRDNWRRISARLRHKGAEWRDEYNMPVDLRHIIYTVQGEMPAGEDTLASAGDAILAISQMLAFPQGLLIRYKPDDTVLDHDEATFKTLLGLYLYDVLAPRLVTEEYRLTREQLAEVQRRYYVDLRRSKIESGEMVGMVAAQGIGETITQTNLKSFHKAGQDKTVAGGMTRVRELSEMTTDIKTPIMKIYLKEPYNLEENYARNVAGFIRSTYLKDLLEGYSICYDPDPESPDSLHHSDETTAVWQVDEGECSSELSGTPWVVRMVFSRTSLAQRASSLLEIKSSFCREYSRRKSAPNDVRKALETVTKIALTSNYDNSAQPVLHIRVNLRDYSYQSLVTVAEMFAERFQIKGLPGVVDSDIHQEKYIYYDASGAMQKGSQWVIESAGVNLGALSRIPVIDLQKTYTNDMHNILRYYGIEAMRTAYMREFSEAIESTGGFSNYQHLELLADLVTHLGHPIPINRYGSNMQDTDPIAKATFEKMTDQMLDAAAYSKSDYMRSVSSRIATGQLIRGGTGIFDLYLDEQVLMEELDHQEVKSDAAEIQVRETRVEDLFR